MSEQDTLAAAILKRMEALNAEGLRLREKEQQMAVEVNYLRAKLDVLREEYVDLDRIYKRYANGKAPVAPPSSSEPQPGPSEYVLKLLAKSAMPRADLVDALTHALASGNVPSTSGDKRKLASSLVGNMLKRNRIRLEGNVVVLNTEENAE